jgi:hypothetical protein
VVQVGDLEYIFFLNEKESKKDINFVSLLISGVLTSRLSFFNSLRCCYVIEIFEKSVILLMPWNEISVLTFYFLSFSA